MIRKYIYVLFVVHVSALLITQASSASYVCPEGFQWFEASCYRVVSDTLTDGIDARTACAQISTGSHLAFIESQSEQTFIEEFIESAGVDTDIWFGLTFTTDKDHQEWLDGSTLGSFTAWDRYGVFNDNSPCVRLRKNSNYLWNDDICSVDYGYVCEVEMCPEGFQWFETSCYRIVSDTLTNGIDARTACAQISTGSHLAFIESQSEQTFIEELIEAAGVDTDIWFGLTFTTDKDHPEWLDGSPLGSFTAWDRYGAFDDSSPCVRLRRDSNYLWNDRGCSLEYGYVCEVEIRVTGNVTETATNDADIQTMQPTTLESDQMTTSSMTASSAVGSSSPTASTCKRRSNHYHLHTAGKTLPDHLIFKTIKRCRSLLRCAAACIGEPYCTWFVYSRNNDCLLSAEVDTDMDQLQSDDLAVLYYMS